MAKGGSCWTEYEVESGDGGGGINTDRSVVRMMSHSVSSWFPNSGKYLPAIRIKFSLFEYASPRFANSCLLIEQRVLEGLTQLFIFSFPD